MTAHLSGDGLFTYQGGSLPLPPAEAARARRLGARVAAVLPAFVGYLGIDLVLAKDAGGTGASAKLDAARALGLPVMLIDRPAVPARREMHDVAAVLRWIDHDADRGV